MRLICMTGVAMCLCAAPRATAQTAVTSAFDSVTEGWAPVNDVALYWSNTDGYAGGYLKGVDQQLDSVWYFSAPPKFLGDKSAAYGQTLDYVIRQTAKNPDVPGYPDVVLRGGGLVLALAYPPPGTNWTPVSVRLDETGGWRVGTLEGPAPTAAQMKAVLRDLTAIEIRGEYSSQWDRADLDNVTLRMSAPVARVLPIVSSFDTSDEGWLARGDTSGLAYATVYSPTDGNPGGCIRASDAGTDVWYFVAPLRFLGDVGSAYGLELRWDLRQGATDSQIEAPDVVLTGESLSLVVDAGPSPGSAWTSYKVRLDATGGWRVGALNGPTATETQIRSVLSALNEFRIRGEFRSGDDTEWLDNVILGGGARVFGDANGDEIVDMTDVRLVLRAAAGLDRAVKLTGLDVAPKPVAASPGYGNGRLDIGDALRILRYVTGREPSLP
jgi:hypothetical protein